MNRVICAAFVCLAVLLSGCGEPASIRKLSANSVVVAFGDSLTFGTGAEPADSYPSILATVLACRVVNAGLPGEDTSAALQRLPEVLRMHKPNLVILCHGGNDMLKGQPATLTTANLEAMVQQVRDAGADVVLVAVPQPQLLLRPAPMYRQLADKHGIPLEPASLSTILASPALVSDPVHPNAAGYRQMAKAIGALIRSSEK